MDEFESKFQNAKISALKEFYGKEKPGFEDGGRVAFGKGSGPFTLKKEGNKVVDVVANTTEAQEQLKNFIEEFRLSKQYGKTSTAAKQAGVLGTRDLYNKYFKDHYTYKTFNQNILGAVKRKYNIKDNPIISSNPKKLQRFNPEVNQKQSEKALQRYYNDTKKIKQKARKVAGLSGDSRFALHHALGLDEFETLNNLIIDKNFKGSKGTTGNSPVEKALRDFEKQMKELKGKVDPVSQRKSQELMAKLNRLKNGKEISYPTKKEPNRKVSFTKDQIGKYGFKADTSTGFKGLDKSQTVGFKAGVPDKLGNKPLSQLNKLEQRKAVTIIAKQLKDLGFKCTVKKANGGPASCNNPLAYLDDIKKQQALAKTGKGSQAAKALKKVSAGKKIFSALLGPGALASELALIVPFAVADYKAGLPNQEIVSNATLGLFGKSRNRRRNELAVKQGYDTKELKRSRDYDAAVNKYRGDNIMEYTQMSPDDLYQFPQQYNKSEEDLYKAIASYEGNKEGIKEAYNKDVKGNESLEEMMRLQDQGRKEKTTQLAQKSMEGPIDSFFASGGIAGILKK